MNTKYILVFAPEGVLWDRIMSMQTFIYCKTAQEARKFFVQSLKNKSDSSMLPLWWLIPYNAIKKYEISVDTFNFKKFFNEISSKQVDLMKNYKCTKIAGFCDYKAPIRNSGLLKRWYEKEFEKHSK